MNELRENIERVILQITPEDLKKAKDDEIARGGEKGVSLNSRAAIYSLDRQLKSSLAANREQKADIERLKQHLTAVQHIAVKLQEQRDELASVGEKWIEIKPNTVLTDQMEVGRWIRKDKWVITRLEGEPAEGWQYIAPNDFFTHYRMLAPPTLPGEEK